MPQKFCRNASKKRKISRIWSLKNTETPQKFCGNALKILGNPPKILGNIL